MEILLLLLIKHAIADLGLQGYIEGTKDKYFSAKLWIHGLHHGIGTFIVLAICQIDGLTAISLAFLDIFLHCQIDYIKTRYITRRNINFETREFWWIQAVDQILHYLTYFLLVGLALG